MGTCHPNVALPEEQFKGVLRPLRLIGMMRVILFLDLFVPKASLKDTTPYEAYVEHESQDSSMRGNRLPSPSHILSPLVK